MPVRVLCRMLYWSLRRNPRVWPHLVAVLAGWLSNLIRLRLLSSSGGPTVAIGMVEHLGDIVAAEPVSRFARQQYPDAKILWVSRKDYAAVPAGFAAVDQVVTVNCLTEWLLLRASGVCRPAWDLHINQRYCPRCQIPLVKTGPAAGIGPASYYRFGNLLAVQCLSAGLPVQTAGPELPPDEAAAGMVAALHLPARFVVIHCRSNEPSRDWPTERWGRLLDHMRVEAIVEVGSRAAVVTSNDRYRRNLCGALSIRQTAEVIRQAVLFIGIDSGPAHLANAVDTPGVVLLGNYKSFDGYMPFSGGYANGQRATIVRTAEAMDTLSVEPVLAAVRHRLGQCSTGLGRRVVAHDRHLALVAQPP